MYLMWGRVRALYCQNVLTGAFTSPSEGSLPILWSCLNMFDLIKASPKGACGGFLRREFRFKCMSWRGSGFGWVCITETVLIYFIFFHFFLTVLPRPFVDSSCFLPSPLLSFSLMFSSSLRTWRFEVPRSARTRPQSTPLKVSYPFMHHCNAFQISL